MKVSSGAAGFGVTFVQSPGKGLRGEKVPPAEELPQMGTFKHRTAQDEGSHIPDPSHLPSLLPFDQGFLTKPSLATLSGENPTGK